ncbi:MAG: Mth938-like domain-containing protein [Thermoleophilia bacterium]
MFIQDYQFGRITIKGKEYTSDVVIYPDRVQNPWRCGRGHDLTIADFDEILQAKPGMLIIGTGRSGLLTVHADVMLQLKSAGVDVFAYRTADAVKLFNSIPKCHVVVAALHLTS